MTRSIPYSSILLKIALGTAAAAILAVAPSPLWAQHGGGHAGGGHFGGGHAAGSAPHMAAPPTHFAAPPPHFSAPPMRMAAPPAARAGTHGFGSRPQPSVHFSARPGEAHPVIGNHVAAPIMITPPHFVNPPHFVPPPHTTIGFPPSEREMWKVNGGSAMSFSGEGHVIWRNSPSSSARIRSTNAIAASRSSSSAAFAGKPRASVNAGAEYVPRRPRPVRPIFSSPVIFSAPIFGFGFGFGSPFFGFNGFHGGFNSLWGPSCGPYWAWGFGCNSLAYGYGYGGYGYDNFGMYEAPNYASNENFEQTQPETQPNYGPFVHEPPAGSSQRDLVELILEDGTVYDVTDYWLEGGELHFTTPNADNNGTTEQVIDLDQLDMQKTVDINTQRGFRFVLRNAPMQEYLQEQEQQNPQENQEQPPQPEQPAPPPAPQEQPNP